MTMAPGVRKLALAAHLTFSVGWIGAVVAYLAFSITALTSQDTELVRSAYLMMETVGWFVIVPLALASLLTGLVMALGTRWGLFRHYWVVFSFGLTVFAVGILLVHMPDVSSLADTARTADPAHLEELDGDLFHPAAGLAILLMIQVLNVYKPKGMTRYGQRKQREQQRKPPDAAPQPDGDRTALLPQR